MAGGNQHQKPLAQKPPSSSAAAANAAVSSPFSNRKSRWGSNNDKNSSSNNRINSNSTAGDPKSSRPNPSPKLNPSPKPDSNSHSGPGPIHHHANGPPRFPFPDPAALGPPPPPAYGFHMLERRSIVMADGSVRSYFALPPDYQDFGPMPPRPVGLAGNRFIGPEFTGGPPRFPPPMSPQGFRDNREHRNGPDGQMKRKHPGEEPLDRRDEADELMRQRHQFMQYTNPNGHPMRPDRFMAGTSSSFRRDMVEERRPPKYGRIDGGGYNGGTAASKHLEVDQAALKKAFMQFVKAIYANQAQRKNFLEDGKQGRLQCIACGRSSKDFPDMHNLIMHAYNSENADLRVDHLALHKALCVLMGWSYAKPPDNSKIYQLLPADEASANQDDLIMWPPMVIICNTKTGKGKDGRMEGYGNKLMDNKVRELGFGGGKAKSLYARDGHMGLTLYRFPGDQAGLKDALELAEYFEKNNLGRKSWSRAERSLLGKDDEKNPNIVKIDERTGEKIMILYGYLATAVDLDKIDIESKKKAVIESLSEYKGVIKSLSEYKASK